MAVDQSSYHEQEKSKNIIRLRELTEQLPAFTEEFFRGAAQIGSFKTKIAYAYDLKVFFTYLTEKNTYFKDKKVTGIELKDLEAVSPDDIEAFLEYISYYSHEDKAYFNDEKAKARKVSAIRSLFTYFYKKKKIKGNPADFVQRPKIHDKNIIRLDAAEVANLIDLVENGEKLTDAQKKYHEKTKLRDTALICLLLGTGIRVSECVGINMDDIDFDSNGVKIMRKGGNESVVYFGEEVRETLMAYFQQRKLILANPGHELAFFLSLQKNRIHVRAVQKLVKKYAALVTSLKKITPHKLRSTYGTNLYQESGDIYLVADALGHKDVNTTRKHYAQMEDDRRRAAAKYIKLRQD